MQAIMPSAANRETIAEKFSTTTDESNAWLLTALADPKHDDAILEGLTLFLEQASKAPFLNTLKLEKRGEWLGANAPDRLQIRVTETARSSQHPAFGAFRTGLARSGGLERAFPKSNI